MTRVQEEAVSARRLLDEVADGLESADLTHRRGTSTAIVCRLPIPRSTSAQPAGSDRRRQLAAVHLGAQFGIAAQK